MSTFLKECFLQKTNQYDALRIKKFCPDALEIGSELQLICEEEDPSYLEMKWTELYECRISRTDYNADENKRISICIFIKVRN